MSRRIGCILLGGLENDPSVFWLQNPHFDTTCQS